MREKFHRVLPTLWVVYPAEVGGDADKGLVRFKVAVKGSWNHGELVQPRVDVRNTVRSIGGGDSSKPHLDMHPEERRDLGQSVAQGGGGP